MTVMLMFPDPEEGKFCNMLSMVVTHDKTPISFSHGFLMMKYSVLNSLDSGCFTDESCECPCDSMTRS